MIVLRGTVDSTSVDGGPWTLLAQGKRYGIEHGDAQGATLACLRPGDRVMVTGHMVGSSLISVLHGTVVLEPDILMDVTDVAESAAGAPAYVTTHIIRRVQPRRFSMAAFIGRTVNTMVELLVRHRMLSNDEIVWKAVHSNAIQLSFAVRASGSIERVSGSLEPFVDALRSGLAALDMDKIELECSLLVPALGLSGRPDIVVRSGGQLTIVELKSGTPDRIDNGSLWKARTSHAMQALAYHAMMSRVDADLKVRASVWYPKVDAKAMIPVGEAVDQLQSLIDVRNELVRFDCDLAQRKASPLTELAHEKLTFVPNFLRNEVLALSYALRNLAALERLYIRCWLTFLAGELHSQRVGPQGLSTLWTTTLEEKRNKLTALTTIGRILDFQDDGSIVQVTFSRLEPGHTSLRSGDLVVVFPRTEASTKGALEVVRGAIIAISDTSVTVSVRNSTRSIAWYSSFEHWIIEIDGLDSSFRRQQSALLTWASMESVQRRQRMIGMMPPRQGPDVRVTDPTLLPSQRAAVGKALSAIDWCLIQGPPGTGKTSAVIRALVTQLHADETERILLLALTNRAADELANVLGQSLGPQSFVRVGSGATGSTERHLSTLAERLTSEEFASLLEHCTIVVSTIAAMQQYSELLDIFKPSTCIIDESSQIVETQVLDILSKANRFILVGDECQLPAIVLQPVENLDVTNHELRSLGITQLGISFFERLVWLASQNNWHWAIARLQEQGRMHQRLANVVGEAFYGGTLRTISERQCTMAPWRVENNWWLSQLYTERVCMVDTGDATDPVEEDCRLAAEVACAIVACSLGDHSSIGIITPFRQTNHRIQMKIPEQYRPWIHIDTVERFQGSERDIIILAACVSNETELAAIRSETQTVFGVVDRKVNVAVSRAREVCLIIGARRVLQTSPGWEIIMRRSSALKRPESGDFSDLLPASIP